MFGFEIRSMSSLERELTIYGCTMPVCRLFTADTNEIKPNNLSIYIFNGYC